MESTTSTLSLQHEDAAEWNRDLIVQFQAALERDPATDLISMFPQSYIREHQYARSRQLSWASKINLHTLSKLYDAFEKEPDVNLISAIPPNYKIRIGKATMPKIPSAAEKAAFEARQPDFREKLDLVQTAKIVFPLSERVIALLARYSRGWLDKSDGAEESLVYSLKKLLWDSTKLWELSVRGVVVKCNEDVVAKVIWGNTDYTEYTSMQYLMDSAPDIPAPRPHGLIAFGHFRVIFMSYIPDKTLTQAWPCLSYEEKVSIQAQLDGIFRRLRTIRQDEGAPIGGVCGEGAKELRVSERDLFKDITTSEAYSDLQFSARHHGSNTYVKYLRSLLEQEKPSLGHGSVFTHGDVRTDNIMVKQEADSGGYTVTGIIDWEDSGFYPPYYECTALTRTFGVIEDDDWFWYLPASIAPAEFPVRWLVDRLWQIHLRTT